MIKLLLLGGLAYLFYGMAKQMGILSKPKDPTIKKKDSYKNLNIKDADLSERTKECVLKSVSLLNHMFENRRSIQMVKYMPL